MTMTLLAPHPEQASKPSDPRTLTTYQFLDTGSPGDSLLKITQPIRRDFQVGNKISSS